MAYLLNFVYAVLLLCLSPVICWRMIRHGRYRRGGMQKLFGLLPRVTSDKPVAWFHAVSVGEVLQTEKVVARFRKATHDAFQVVVTTSTDTGFDLADARFDGCLVTWCPLDFSWAVKNAIARLRPRMLVLMELEIWPNLLSTCQKAGIHTAVVNARMSDNSFRGYRRIRPVLAALLSRLSLVAAQSQESADRLMSLGASGEATVVTGSVKFDGVQTNRRNEGTNALRQVLGVSREATVLIAGSTQHPEENAALDAWEQLRKQHANLRLILVPRHRERFDEVASLVASRGVAMIRRSELDSAPVNRVAPEADQPVIVLDTIGELSACWGLADIAFVGGSFGARGGQNMLEPAAYGAAVLFGPNTKNFRDIVRLLLASDAAIEVPAADELQSCLQTLLSDTKERIALGQRAQRVVVSHQGAVGRTIERLTELLAIGRSESDKVVDKAA